MDSVHIHEGLGHDESREFAETRLDSGLDVFILFWRRFVAPSLNCGLVIAAGILAITFG